MLKKLMILIMCLLITSSLIAAPKYAFTNKHVTNTTIAVTSCGVTDEQFKQRIVYSILRASAEYDIDPIILVAVISKESNFNPAAKGAAGEIGLCQIRPSIWCKELGVTKEQLRDPEINIFTCARILSREYSKHKSMFMTLQRYNSRSSKGTQYAYAVQNHIKELRKLTNDNG